MPSKGQEAGWQKYVEELEKQASNYSLTETERQTRETEDVRQRNSEILEERFVRSQAGFEKLKGESPDMVELEKKYLADISSAVLMMTKLDSFPAYADVRTSLAWIHDHEARYQEGDPVGEPLKTLQAFLESQMSMGKIHEGLDLGALQKYLEQEAFVLSRVKVEQELAATLGNAEYVLLHNRGRLIMEDKDSRVFDDSVAIRNGCENFLDWQKEKSRQGGQKLNFTPEEIQAISKAALLHDIGKTGSEIANAQEQEAVIKLFAIDNIGAKPEEITVLEVVKSHFRDWREILRSLDKSGIGEGWSMREFYNIHSKWSHENLSQHDEGELVDRLVAPHHAYRVDNFTDYPFWDTNFKKDDIADTPELRQVYLARLLMIMDVLQGTFARGKYGVGEKLDAEGVFRQTAELIGPKFKDDAICQSILADLRNLDLKQLFTKTPNEAIPEPMAA